MTAMEVPVRALASCLVRSEWPSECAISLIPHRDKYCYSVGVHICCLWWPCELVETGRVLLFCITDSSAQSHLIGGCET